MKAFLIISFLFPLCTWAVVMEPKAGFLKFHATASPGALSINGTGDFPSGKIEYSESGDQIEISGALKMKIDSFKTGISIRDSHLKDKYLEASKYPEALLIIPKQKISKNGGDFHGDLVLHGTRHTVAGKAEVSEIEKGRKSVRASFPIRLEDHSIEIPKFAGVSVSNDVRVETEFELGTAQ